ncbi:MAG TPA: hypothetical protein PL110_20090 [Candidatus Eremiobacteraeota bacterium]|nr:hypothetical protein [Candidatus Eremiobacteraeota bacterium]
MKQYLTLPLTITVILFLLISTVIVYYFDITGNPIWNTPKFIPFILIIPLAITGWLPLGFYALYIYKKEKNTLSIIMLLITIIWIISLLVFIGCTIRFLIELSNKFLGF